MKLQTKQLFLVATAWVTVQSVFALETAKVISSTPVVEQINVPNQSCANVPMVVQQAPTGAGAMLGAIAGGVVGSAVGQGAGNAAATALGVMGGAVIGNNMEASKATVVPTQQCNTQYTLQSRVTHYNVIYEYAGKQYNVQMPSDPGPTLSIELTPANAMNNAPTLGAPGVAAVANTPAPTYVQPVYNSAPVYVNPYPYAYPYYAPFPVGVSIGFGGYYGRGHWR